VPAVKILVLGGGAQGRVIATELARALPASPISVADVHEPELPALANLRWIEADLANHGTIGRLLHEHELGVGALPSRLGFAAMKAAIETRRHLVDVSRAAQNPLPLDRDARAAGVTIVPDCGIAPGLSNLLIGHAVTTHGTPEEVTVLAGAVAEDPSAPYGYVVTWSLDDLLEEYQRPARIIENGRRTTVPVFSGLERVEVDGVGAMEAFYSDGLRTLLDTIPDVRVMGEKTLRWPGHVEAVRPLVAISRLVEEFRDRCAADPARDLVVLVVRLRWGRRTERVTLVERYDPVSGLTAMARSNALTTAAVALFAAEGGLTTPGVQPLEVLGRDERAYRFMIDAVERHGVRLTHSV
jgi:saccharopine dehydrogenase-like NADP-dependent oxidoreductase